MKTITPALQTFLLDTAPLEFNRVDLCTIALSNGDTLRVLWGGNVNITYGGNTYYAAEYGTWERGPYSNSATYRPGGGSMNLTALMNTQGEDAVYYPGTTTTLLEAVNAGLFNAAQVNIQTIFWPTGLYPNLPTTTFSLAANANTGWPGGTTSGVAMGTMQLNTGQIGACENTGRSKVSFKLFDLLYILNRPAPPFQLQTACRHVLFDAGCTLLKANFTSTPQTLDSTATTLYLTLDLAAHQTGHSYAFGNLILVSGVPYMCTTAGKSAATAPTFHPTRAAITTDGSTLVWTSMNQAYPQGYVTFTSGNNSGLSYSVKAQVIASGKLQLQLLKPTALSVSHTDAVELVPGCDKTIPTCTNVYNNLVHIGNPGVFTPNPELAQ
jgi:hypothetical protein